MRAIRRDMEYIVIYIQYKIRRFFKLKQLIFQYFLVIIQLEVIETICDYLSHYLLPHLGPGSQYATPCCLCDGVASVFDRQSANITHRAPAYRTALQG